MRAKRSKKYKKQMQQLHMHYGFREPYQVLVDADLVREAQHCTMDLQAFLERTLHGKVKIMITQCSIRHLYSQNREPGVAKAIDQAKTFERRRCGHKPEDFEKPLSTLECLRAVVDPKETGENKHRYVVATQDRDVRRYMSSIAGVPMIYINRSVMIMEPLSNITVEASQKAEIAKFRSGLRQRAGEKRKREEDDDDKSNRIQPGDGAKLELGDNDGDSDNDNDADIAADDKPAEDKQERKKKRARGPSGPNPLSMKKKKSATSTTTTSSQTKAKDSSKVSDEANKKKRKRKHKAKPTEDGGAETAGGLTGGQPMAVGE